MKIYSFEKLEAWKIALEMRLLVHEIAAKFPSHERFELASQIKRSSSSVGDCLAEGSGRITGKDKAHFSSMAYASALETLNHLIVALRLSYINETEYFQIRTILETLTQKVSLLRRSQLAVKV